MQQEGSPASLLLFINSLSLSPPTNNIIMLQRYSTGYLTSYFLPLTSYLLLLTSNTTHSAIPGTYDRTAGKDCGD